MEFHFKTTDSNKLHTDDHHDEEQEQEEEEEEEHNFIPSASTSSPPQTEHMFDKIVTPSDVGKLNRLVIPKQHAEKYFPLEPSTHDRGLLLNFTDRNGKPWRFRYSYWNSSQSYVMTKGWSRFVKEKGLDAGDTVSFCRGIGPTQYRLFIDSKRRPDPPARFPTTASVSPTTARPHHPYLSFARSASAPWAASRLFVSHASRPNPVSNNYFCVRSNAAVAAPPNPVDPRPGPIVAERKRFRLFGVNLELSREEEGDNN